MAVVVTLSADPDRGVAVRSGSANSPRLIPAVTTCQVSRGSLLFRSEPQLGHRPRATDFMAPTFLPGAVGAPGERPFIGWKGYGSA